METRDKKMDRRSMRSKMAILDAFASLVLENELKDISVTDIVERANIGRTTFYAHFEDIPDLHRFIFSRLLRQIEEEIENIQADTSNDSGVYQSLIPSRALFTIAVEKHAIFKMNAVTPGAGLDMLVKPLIERFEKQLDDLGATVPPGDISRRMIGTYLFSALIALLIDWVLEDMPEPPEAMDRKFQMLAEPTLQLLID